MYPYLGPDILSQIHVSSWRHLYIPVVQRLQLYGLCNIISLCREVMDIQKLYAVKDKQQGFSVATFILYFR